MNNVVLAVEDLAKSFGEIQAVAGLSFEVRQGEVFGFLGPNGAGKTTSINMICGLLQPDRGRVTIKGQAVKSSSPRTLRRVGMAPQEIIIWEKLTCLEQLKFLGRMYGLSSGQARERGLRLLQDLDLAEKKNQLAGTLSGGMKRRLNLALALIHDPEILVLDEPEAGLDPQARVLVRDYIKSLARQKTVILTTHNMDEADRVSDRVAIIDHGQLLVLDQPEILKHRLGEGDVLEITLGAPAQAEAAQALVQADIKGISLAVLNDTLTIRAKNLAAMLPAILASVNRGGLKCEELRLRESTLEDVFIQLTGRRLRE